MRSGGFPLARRYPNDYHECHMNHPVIASCFAVVEIEVVRYTPAQNQRRADDEDEGRDELPRSLIGYEDFSQSTA